MAKTRKDKAEMLKKYDELVKDSKAIVIVKSKKLTPNESSSLKKEVHDFGTKFNVIKNNVFKIALKNNNLDEEESLNFGEHSALFMSDDFVNPSKILKKFIADTAIDKNEFKVEIVSGYLEGEKLTQEQVVELAEMPEKEQSIAMILGVLDQAISGVLNVLEDAPRSIASVIDQAFPSEN